MFSSIFLPSGIPPPGPLISLVPAPVQSQYNLDNLVYFPWKSWNNSPFRLIALEANSRRNQNSNNISRKEISLWICLFFTHCNNAHLPRPIFIFIRINKNNFFRTFFMKCVIAARLISSSNVFASVCLS